MKTLYISDLDGTLLNNDGELSQNTEIILNHLIDNSVMFSLATARTYSTVVPMMKNIKNTRKIFMAKEKLRVPWIWSRVRRKSC